MPPIRHLGDYAYDYAKLPRGDAKCRMLTAMQCQLRQGGPEMWHYYAPAGLLLRSKMQHTSRKDIHIATDIKRIILPFGNSLPHSPTSLLGDLGFSSTTRQETSLLLNFNHNGNSSHIRCPYPGHRRQCSIPGIGQRKDHHHHWRLPRQFGSRHGLRPGSPGAEVIDLDRAVCRQDSGFNRLVEIELSRRRI